MDTCAWKLVTSTHQRAAACTVCEFALPVGYGEFLLNSLAVPPYSCGHLGSMARVQKIPLSKM